jgi:hypothetical protein
MATDVRDEPEGANESEREDADEAETAAERQRRERKAKERRHVAAEEEPIPVFGGRLLIAAVMLAAMVVIPMSSAGNLLEPKEEIAPPSAWAIGQTATVAITVITADYNKLTCASDKEFDGAHCQYKTEKELWPRQPDAPLEDNKRTVLQPYRTANDNRLILVSGLWATPEVATRLHKEPPTGVAEEKLARFIAQCEVKFVGNVPGVRLRWNPSGGWTSPDATEPEPFVAKPVSCKILNPP